MRISTRTRYGVRFLLELGACQGNGPIFLKDIAKSQEISEKYLSQIVIDLKGAGLINGYRGAHGGYVLAREAGAITLAEVVGLLEGDLKLVDCLRESSRCGRAPECVTQEVWMRLGAVIEEALGKITLAELVKRKKEKAGGSGKSYGVFGV